MNAAVMQQNAIAEKKEYWRWEETAWIAPDKDWRAAKILTCGIDVGSVSSQAVLVADGELYGYNSMRTGSNSPDSARNALAGAHLRKRGEHRGKEPRVVCFS